MLVYPEFMKELDDFLKEKEAVYKQKFRTSLTGDRVSIHVRDEVILNMWDAAATVVEYLEAHGKVGETVESIMRGMLRFDDPELPGLYFFTGYRPASPTPVQLDTSIGNPVEITLEQLLTLRLQKVLKKA